MDATTKTIRRKERGLTREEAIKVLENIPIAPTYGYSFNDIGDAIYIAVEALNAQDSPIICPRCGRTFSEAEGRESEE